MTVSHTRNSWHTLFVGVLLLLGFCSCEQPVREFPIDRALTNSSGKQIDATLIGRTESVVSFRKRGESKGKVYNYKIADLSESDGRFIRTLPLEAYVPPPKPDNSPKARRIAALKEDIEALKLKIEAKGAKMENSSAFTKAKLKVASSQMDELKRTLRNKIADLQFLESDSLN